MIRLGLRLTLNGGREAGARLAATVAAVAIGVAMLLLTLAGINGVNSQNARYAWLETGYLPGNAASHPTAGTDPAWWDLRADLFQGKLIGRADVAATGPHPPVPPGIPALPGPGEFYASPALTTLLRTTPTAELGDRFSAHQVGTISAAGLPAPDSLIIVVGHTVADLSHRPDVTLIYSINATVPSSCANCAIGVGIDASGIDLILSIVALALLFPVLMFIGSASRLSAARREQRFAAMRLAGATPRQIAVIASVESSVATLAGVAAGFAIFFLVRAPFAAIPFTGAPFYPHDLSLHLVDVLAVGLGVPVTAALVSRLVLRRLQVSPLGVSRGSTARVAHAYRAVPLVAGLGELVFFVWHGRPSSTVGQIEAFLTGILVVMVGLVLIGPWVTMVGARAMAGRTSRPATLIAGRRLADNPQAAFRAISGLVLALYVTSAAVATIDGFTAERGVPRGDVTASGTLVEELSDLFSPRPSAAAPVEPALLTSLRAVPGVHGVAVVRSDPAVPVDPREGTPGVVSCAELAGTPFLGRCSAGATVALIYPDLSERSGDQTTVWPAASVPAATLAGLAAQAIVVGTDGSPAAIERARSVLEETYWRDEGPTTIGELDQNSSRQTREYEQLANVVVLTSLPVAGASLAVSLAAGLSERKRPFSLLRLTGVPLGMLRRVIAAETAVPLLAGAVVAIGVGFLCAQLFLSAQLGYNVRPPGLAYYVAVLGGLVASLAIIGSTFPLLAKITGPENARNE